jgi:hypothetical protein
MKRALMATFAVALVLAPSAHAKNIQPANDGGGGTPRIECFQGSFWVWNGSYWSHMGVPC